MLYVIFIVMGLAIGGVLDESFFGACAGALIGILFARSIKARTLIWNLQTELNALKSAQVASASTETRETTIQAPTEPDAPSEPEPVVLQQADMPVEAMDTTDAPTPEPIQTPAPAPLIVESAAGESLTDKAAQAFGEVR
ncbi:MAG: hypothetical protein AAFY60_16775, partial [Myxococcota bacterium]